MESATSTRTHFTLGAPERLAVLDEAGAPLYFRSSSRSRTISEQKRSTERLTDLTLHERG